MVHLVCSMTLLTTLEVFLQLDICIFGPKRVIPSNRIIREDYRFINKCRAKLFI